MPIWVSLMCRSRFIGSTSREIVVRSMKENMYISMSTATLYHAANEEGYADVASAVLIASECAAICPPTGSSALTRLQAPAAHPPSQYPDARGPRPPAMK